MNHPSFWSRVALDHYESTDSSVSVPKQLDQLILPPKSSQASISPSFLLNCTLRNFQEDAVRWMLDRYNRRINAIIADEMGLGKTIETLGFLLSVCEQHQLAYSYDSFDAQARIDADLPQLEAALLSLLSPAYQSARLNTPSFLIVSPLSVIDSWQEHLRQMCDPAHIAFMKLQGSRVEREEAVELLYSFKEYRHNERIEEWKQLYQDILATYTQKYQQRYGKNPNSEIFPPMIPNTVVSRVTSSLRRHIGADVVLVTYESISQEIDTITKHNFTSLIVDEAHRLKNPQAQLYRLIRDRVSWNHSFFLTGTPCQNALSELWALLALLCLPHPLSGEALTHVRTPTHSAHTSSSSSSPALSSLSSYPPSAVFLSTIAKTPLWRLLQLSLLKTTVTNTNDATDGSTTSASTSTSTSATTSASTCPTSTSLLALLAATYQQPPLPHHSPLSEFPPDSEKDFSEAFQALQSVTYEQATSFISVLESAEFSISTTNSMEPGTGTIANTGTGITISPSNPLYIARMHLRALLSVYILRRTKTDVSLSLPPKRTIVVYTSLTPLQLRLYRAVLVRNTKTLLSCVGMGGAEHNLHDGKTDQMGIHTSYSGFLTKTEQARTTRCLSNIVISLNKIINHPYLIPGVEQPPYEQSPHLYENSAKLAFLHVLLRRLRRDGHRVLLFSTSTMMLDIVQDYADYQGYSVCRLDGSVRGQERTDMIQRFQGTRASNPDDLETHSPMSEDDNEPFLFLLSTRAGGVGVTLTKADTVIFFDGDYNPAADEQAENRCHRIGQTKPVLVIKMVTKNTLEQVFYARAKRKMAMATVVLGGGVLGISGNSEMKKIRKSLPTDSLGAGSTRSGNLLVTGISSTPSTSGKENELDSLQDAILNGLDRVFVDVHTTWTDNDVAALVARGYAPDDVTGMTTDNLKYNSRGGLEGVDGKDDTRMVDVLRDQADTDSSNATKFEVLDDTSTHHPSVPRTSVANAAISGKNLPGEVSSADASLFFTKDIDVNLETTGLYDLVPTAKKPRYAGAESPTGSSPSADIADAGVRAETGNLGTGAHAHYPVTSTSTSSILLSLRTQADDEAISLVLGEAADEAEADADGYGFSYDGVDDVLGDDSTISLRRRSVQKRLDGDGASVDAGTGAGGRVLTEEEKAKRMYVMQQNKLRQACEAAATHVFKIEQRVRNWEKIGYFSHVLPEGEEWTQALSTVISVVVQRCVAAIFDRIWENCTQNSSESGKPAVSGSFSTVTAADISPSVLHSLRRLLLDMCCDASGRATSTRSNTTNSTVDIHNRSASRSPLSLGSSTTPTTPLDVPLFPLASEPAFPDILSVTDVHQWSQYAILASYETLCNAGTLSSGTGTLPSERPWRRQVLDTVLTQTCTAAVRAVVRAVAAAVLSDLSEGDTRRLLDGREIRDGDVVNNSGVVVGEARQSSCIGGASYAEREGVEESMVTSKDEVDTSTSAETTSTTVLDTNTPSATSGDATPSISQLDAALLVPSFTSSLARACAMVRHGVRAGLGEAMASDDISVAVATSMWGHSAGDTSYDVDRDIDQDGDQGSSNYGVEHGGRTQEIDALVDGDADVANDGYGECGRGGVGVSGVSMNQKDTTQSLHIGQRLGNAQHRSGVYAVYDQDAGVIRITLPSDKPLSSDRALPSDVDAVSEAPARHIASQETSTENDVDLYSRKYDSNTHDDQIVAQDHVASMYHVEGNILNPEKVLGICNSAEYDSDSQCSLLSAAPSISGDPVHSVFSRCRGYILFNYVDNSGVWGSGGLFNALAALSPQCTSDYYAAKVAKELTLGSAVLTELPAADVVKMLSSSYPDILNDTAISTITPHHRVFVCNMVCMGANRRITANTVAAAAARVAVLAKTLGLCVLTPKVGFSARNLALSSGSSRSRTDSGRSGSSGNNSSSSDGSRSRRTSSRTHSSSSSADVSGNDTWYAIERALTSTLVARGVAVVVFYHQRGRGRANATTPARGRADSASVRSRVDAAVSLAGADAETMARDRAGVVASASITHAGASVGSTARDRVNARPHMQTVSAPNTMLATIHGSVSALGGIPVPAAVSTPAMAAVSHCASSAISTAATSRAATCSDPRRSPGTSTNACPIVAPAASRLQRQDTTDDASLLAFDSDEEDMGPGALRPPKPRDTQILETSDFPGMVRSSTPSSSALSTSIPTSSFHSVSSSRSTSTPMSGLLAPEGSMRGVELPIATSAAAKTSASSESCAETQTEDVNAHACCFYTVDNRSYANSHTSVFTVTSTGGNRSMIDGAAAGHSVGDHAVLLCNSTTLVPPPLSETQTTLLPPQWRGVAWKQRYLSGMSVVIPENPIFIISRRFGSTDADVASYVASLENTWSSQEKRQIYGNVLHDMLRGLCNLGADCVIVPNTFATGTGVSAGVSMDNNSATPCVDTLRNTSTPRTERLRIAEHTRIRDVIANVTPFQQYYSYTSTVARDTLKKIKEALNFPDLTHLDVMVLVKASGILVADDCIPVSLWALLYTLHLESLEAETVKTLIVRGFDISR